MQIVTNLCHGSHSTLHPKSKKKRVVVRSPNLVSRSSELRRARWRPLFFRDITQCRARRTTRGRKPRCKHGAIISNSHRIVSRVMPTIAQTWQAGGRRCNEHAASTLTCARSRTAEISHLPTFHDANRDQPLPRLAHHFASKFEKLKSGRTATKFGGQVKRDETNTLASSNSRTYRAARRQRRRKRPKITMQTWRDYLQFASHRFIVWCTLLLKLGRRVVGSMTSTLRAFRGAGERSRPRYRICQLFTMRIATNLCHGSRTTLHPNSKN